MFCKLPVIEKVLNFNLVSYLVFFVNAETEIR